MALNDFGVTVESVRKHHFPNADAWTETSRPAESAVAEAIQEEAGVLAGALLLEAIDASTIAQDSPAYVSCRKTLRMMVAMRIVADMTGQDPAVAKKWERAVEKWMDALDEGGDTFLGGGATSTTSSDPDGPTDFIGENSLEVGASADMSDVVPTLRRKDEL